MGRMILALVCGVVTALGMIIVGKMIAIGSWPTGSAMEFMTRGELVTYFSSQPLSFNLTLLFGSLVGAFLGGYVVTNMSRREKLDVRMSMAVGIFLILGGLLNFFVLLPGSPAWLIATTLVSYIPVTMLGNKLA